jgi:hypothetical protein
MIYRKLDGEHFDTIRKHLIDIPADHKSIHLELPFLFTNNDALNIKQVILREIAKVFASEQKKENDKIPLYATILDRIEADYALSVYKHDERMKFHIEENWEQKLKLNACDELRLKIFLRDDENRKKVFFVPAQNNSNNQKKKG